MRKMRFFKKEKNNSTLNTLANALASRKHNNVSTGSFNPVSGGGGSYNQNNSDNTMQGAFKLGKGLTDLYNAGKDKGWFGGNGETSGLVGSAADSYISSGATSSSAIGDAISGVGSSGGGSAVSSAIGSEVGSGLASSAGSSGGGWGGFGGGSGGGAPWGLIAKAAKTGYNGISGKDDTEYSDLEETMIYPVQGAAIGGSYGGGWGALGGALYGLGYSFKDDVGLKDNNWLTTVLFPIGMGDEHEGIIQV